MRSLDEWMHRHPSWISRLETKDYAPIAQVVVGDLLSGDIIDVRDFRIEVKEGQEYLTIDLVHRDALGTHGFVGKLPDGTVMDVAAPNGVPMNRRRVVRYARRKTI